MAAGLPAAAGSFAKIARQKPRRDTAPGLCCHNGLAEFAPRTARRVQIVICRGVYPKGTCLYNRSASPCGQRLAYVANDTYQTAKLSECPNL